MIARRRGGKRENEITQRHEETEAQRGHNDKGRRNTTTKPPNSSKGGWMEGGRRGKAIVRVGGFALDGREGSGHNEGGARENMRQR